MRDMPQTTPLPGIVKIMGESCNLVANKVYLMAAPVIMDLFLLFGPKLRISNYFRPFFETAFQQLINTAGTGVRQLEFSIELLNQALESVNLFGFLQTYPIGVKALLLTGSAQSPLGKTAEIQLSSLLQILPAIAGIIIAGVFLGSFYYSVTAAFCSKSDKHFSWKKFGNQLLNVIVLYIALIVLLFIIAIPCGCLLTFSFMISPVVYQIITLIMLVVLCWLVIPLFFIPQGIFLYHLDFPNAVRHSIKIASWAGTLIIRFILLSLVLSFGLDMIWSIPDRSSWLILISIFGHAFVSTALLASSFILFRELDQWQAQNRSFLDWRKSNLRIMQLIKKEPETHE